MPSFLSSRKFGMSNWFAYCGMIWSKSTINTRVGCDGTPPCAVPPPAHNGKTNAMVAAKATILFLEPLIASSPSVRSWMMLPPRG